MSGSLTQQAGETAEGFKARQDAARAFTTRQQNLAGLAPQVAGLRSLQQQAQTLAQAGLGSFQPFLNQHNTSSFFRWNCSFNPQALSTIYVTVSTTSY